VAAARISAKNGLESYTYNLHNSLSDEKLANKFDAADKSKLEGAVNDMTSWLDALQEASMEEYNKKQKELEVIANPIMQKLYAQAGAGAGAGVGGFPAGAFPGGALDVHTSACDILEQGSHLGLAPHSRLLCPHHHPYG